MPLSAYLIELKENIKVYCLNKHQDKMFVKVKRIDKN